MNKIDKCRKLAAEITSYFEGGICLDNHAKTYIETCFQDIPFQDLIERIRNNPDSDDAPLMELIFFPEKSLQLRLEPFLEKDAFCIEDESEVTGLLIEANIQTTLREAGSNAAISIKVPPPVFDSFVRRLKISRQIPRQLIDTIHEIFPATETSRLKVELRNTRFPFSPKATSFLDSFLKGIDPATEDFHDCLGLVLALLDEQKHERDPYRLLMSKRESYLRAKRAADDFMQKLQHDNMETLMHRGIRAPEIGIEEAERKIELLEHIIDAITTNGSRF
jgi:hypothetical protein